MRRRLTNQEIAVIMETRNELMATPNARGEDRKIAPPSFWWAVGEAFGVDQDAAKRAVEGAERYGMSRQ